MLSATPHAAAPLHLTLRQGPPPPAPLPDAPPPARCRRHSPALIAPGTRAAAGRKTTAAVPRAPPPLWPAPLVRCRPATAAQPPAPGRPPWALRTPCPAA